MLRTHRKQLTRHVEVDEATLGLPDASDDVIRRRDLVAALNVLPPLDSEALMLITWHDLSHSEACATTLERDVDASRLVTCINEYGGRGSFRCPLAARWTRRVPRWAGRGER